MTPLILAGRPAAGMPAFSLPSADIDAIVAFIHDAKTKTESEKGNRRSVDVEDLQTGDAEAGKQYFNGAGGCAKCHSVSGSFASVGSRASCCCRPRATGTSSFWTGPMARAY